MAKFHGAVGYGIRTLIRPGVWEEVITEEEYFGDTLSNIRDIQSSETLNDNINVANKISILADQFANENFHLMRYVVFMGQKWKVTRVEVQSPRLILTVGGVYVGKSN